MEARGNEGGVGQAGIARRIGAGDVKVTEGGRLVDEDVAGQVDREIDPCRGECPDGAADAGLVGVIERGGDRALVAGKRRGAGNALFGIATGHDEGDRAEALLFGGDLPCRHREHQRRGRPARAERGAVADHPPRGAGRLQPVQRRGICKRARHPRRAGRIGKQPVDGLGQPLRHGVEALVALIGLDPAAGHEDRLRRAAHLAGIERQREGEVVAHAGEIGACGDGDGVHPGFLGEEPGLGRRAAKPGPEGRRAGEIDQPHRRIGGQPLRHRRLGRIGGEQHGIGGQARLGKDLAQHPHGQRERQDRRRMRLDDHRITGRQTGEKPRIGVPGREGVAADHQRQPGRHQRPVLLQHQRRGLALRLFPTRRGGKAGHLVPGHRHRLETAILRMRAARLKGHGKGLTGGVHRRRADQEADPVQPLQRLDQRPDPRLGAGRRESRRRDLRRRDQRGGIGGGIGDAERRPEGRDLGPDLRGPGMARQHEELVQKRRKARLAIGARGLAIDLAARRLGERRPEATRLERLHGIVQQGAVARKQIGHDSPPAGRSIPDQVYN
ncbi:hypothetical protein SDC9_49086 [bioreactor metagenome]|uniref:Uncharacterized protein n=1 Tax=bioreactor metagenome TaxID=1076179 RepID=A0A644WH88_9ZZZZ